MKNWWKNTVVYELYTQSFKDTNGDGIGDIDGIIEKLDYLKNLGVGALWLTPIYKSPLVDNGYDIADYQDINPLYGDINKFKKLIEIAKTKNIKIIMDLVLNHTSDQHEWFINSKKSKENKYRNFYIWRDKPDNTKSVFGGPAWTYDEDSGQYYFHLFAKEQPDLNWENEMVRTEIAKMIKWWVDLGVGGFRLDVIDLIGKEIDKNIISNGPNLHKFIKELREKSWMSDEFLTVGECWGATLEDGFKYSNPQEKELSMVFQFEHISNLNDEIGKYKYKKVNFIELKNIFRKWQQGLHNRGWNSLFLGNHDLPRMVSKYGDDKKYRIESSKTLFTTLFLMEGTPFIYQGDEIGMTNTGWNDLGRYKDIEIRNTYKDLVEISGKITKEEFMLGLKTNGRDHARTPLQWDDSLYAGFSKAKPWIDINDNFKDVNVQESLKDDNSIYNYLKKLIQFRTNSEYSDLIIDGLYVPTLIEDPDLFAYARTNENQTIKVLANWSAKDLNVGVINIENLKVLLNTHQNFDGKTLQPWQTIVLLEDRLKFK